MAVFKVGDRVRYKKSLAVGSGSLTAHYRDIGAIAVVTLASPQTVSIRMLKPILPIDDNGIWHGRPSCWMELAYKPTYMLIS